jgi:hypothetical protein
MYFFVFPGIPLKALRFIAPYAVLDYGICNSCSIFAILSMVTQVNQGAEIVQSCVKSISLHAFGPKEHKIPCPKKHVCLQIEFMSFAYTLRIRSYLNILNVLAAVMQIFALVTWLWKFLATGVHFLHTLSNSPSRHTDTRLFDAVGRSCLLMETFLYLSTCLFFRLLTSLFKVKCINLNDTINLILIFSETFSRSTIYIYFHCSLLFPFRCCRIRAPLQRVARLMPTDFG